MTRRTPDTFRAKIAPSHDRHITEIGPREEFQFTEAQWERIAAQMPGAPGVDQYRHDIEMAAAWLVHRRQNPELSPGYRPPSSDKRVTKKIETAARNLSLAFEQLSGFARMHLEGMFGASHEGPIVDRAQRLAAFKADVDRIARAAPYFLNGIQSSGLKLKGKADPARIVAWANATAWWEHATGKEAKAFPKSEASPSREPDGPYVRFLKAFSEAIPGETKPTGGQIRNFVRVYWGNGKKHSWQTGKW
jgi:hypothetical protein